MGHHVYTYHIYTIRLVTRLDILALARHTHEFTPALATRTLTLDTIVRVEIKRPQDLKEQRTFWIINSNYNSELSSFSNPKEHRFSSDFTAHCALKSAFSRWKRCGVTIHIYMYIHIYTGCPRLPAFTLVCR